MTAKITPEEMAMLIVERILQYGESVHWGQRGAMMVQFEMEDIVLDCLNNPQLPPMPEGYTGEAVKQAMREAIRASIERQNAST